MNIGVDLDNTLFDTKKTYLEYLEKFTKEQKIDIFEWYNSSDLKEKFYKLYLSNINNEASLIKNAKDTINLLRKLGNKIYIITNRSEKYVNNCSNNIKKLLKDNGVGYDEIYMVNDNKAAICQKLKIDYMIDDSILIYNELIKNDINVILFDKDKKYNNISRKVTDWKEIIDFIMKSK